MAESAQQGQRVFLALWPPTAVQDRAHAAARELVRRGRLVPARNLHITLAFLGELGDDALSRLEDLAGTIRAEPFTLRLTQLGCWQRRGIAWLAPERVPEPLEGLHAALAGALAHAGFAVDRRRFTPHITLARRAVVAREGDVEPIPWTVADFRLIRSDLRPRGAVYTRLRSWPLAGPAASGDAP